jgi:hypothetical protein
MQRLKQSRSVVLASIVGLACVASAAFAEDKKPEATTPPSTYRVEISIKEMDGSKQVNSRHYVMTVEDRNWGRIRVGNRVPLATSVGEEKGTTSYQWQDTGMNIDCHPSKIGESLYLSINVEASGLASEEQTSKLLPIFRQQRLQAGGVVTLGKPTLMGSMDDVTSNHRYDVEVTATEVK